MSVFSGIQLSQFDWNLQCLLFNKGVHASLFFDHIFHSMRLLIRSSPIRSYHEYRPEQHSLIELVQE